MFASWISVIRTIFMIFACQHHICLFASPLTCWHLLSCFIWGGSTEIHVLQFLRVHQLIDITFVKGSTSWCWVTLHRGRFMFCLQPALCWHLQYYTILSQPSDCQLQEAFHTLQLADTIAFTGILSMQKLASSNFRTTWPLYAMLCCEDSSSAKILTLLGGDCYWVMLACYAPHTHLDNLRPRSLCLCQ